MMDRNASKMLSEVGVGEGQSVLDFGCGSGTYSIPAAKLVGKFGRIYSLDVSRGALDKLSRKAEREGLENIVTLYSSGSVEIPIDDGELDHLLLIDVLQEISNKELLLEEAHRILKPDGLIVVYPMHIDVNDFIRTASNAKFRLMGKRFQEKILVFEKS
jgi:ubiquinone/menaquinone biosynthesis C-methylase UbiE